MCIFTEEQNQQTVPEALVHCVVLRLGALLVLVLTVGEWPDVLHVIIALLGEAACLLPSQDLLQSVLKVCICILRPLTVKLPVSPLWISGIIPVVWYTNVDMGGGKDDLSRLIRAFLFLGRRGWSFKVIEFQNPESAGREHQQRTTREQIYVSKTWFYVFEFKINKKKEKYLTVTFF